MDYDESLKVGGRFSFDTEVIEASAATSELLEALRSPKTAAELSNALGITIGAVRRRIFSARKSGYSVHLTRDGLYWRESSQRYCHKCGQKLSRYNKSATCFLCQDGS